MSAYINKIFPRSGALVSSDDEAEDVMLQQDATTASESTSQDLPSVPPVALASDSLRAAILDALAEVDAMAASAGMLQELPDADRAAVMLIADDLLLGRAGAVEDTEIDLIDGGALAMLPGADWLIPFTETAEGVQVFDPSSWLR